MRILGSILMGSMLIGAHPALSQSANADSGNYFLPHCRAFMDPGNPSAPNFKTEHLSSMGQCGGVVSAMIFVGKYLPPEFRYCVPEGANIGQGTRVVIQYLEANPNLLHYDFRTLVIAAFKTAWPCK
jgi:hypothetical protein